MSSAEKPSPRPRHQMLKLRDWGNVSLEVFGCGGDDDDADGDNRHPMFKLGDRRNVSLEFFFC